MELVEEKCAAGDHPAAHEKQRSTLESRT